MTNYNFESVFWKGAVKQQGILKDKTSIFFQTKSGEIEELQWMSDKDFQALIKTRQHPWKNGYWINDSKREELFEITNNTAIKKQIAHLEYPDILQRHLNIGTLTFGDFGGNVPEDLKALTGESRFNVEYSGTYGFHIQKGILNSEGTKLSFKNHEGKNEDIHRISETESQSLLKSQQHPWLDGYWTSISEGKHKVQIGKLQNLPPGDILVRFINFSYF